MPDPLELRVYVDSNVLFSASYVADHDFLAIWNLHGVEPITSRYAVGEVSRNIKSAEHRRRFEALLERTQFVSDADVRYVPSSIVLVPKDRPILAAAIFSSADFLVTGDVNHFGHLLDRKVENVSILRPANFLLLHRDRLTRG